jgi:hypothetical protein
MVGSQMYAVVDPTSYLTSEVLWDFGFLWVVLSIGLKVMAMDPLYIYLLHVPPPQWRFIF